MACDERRGLAVRLVQVAHHLLKARALVEAVGPKRLHLFTVAQLRPPPVPRSGARPARSAAGVRPAPPPVLGSASATAAAGYRLAEPPEHLRLVAGFNGHHLAFHTSTLAPVVNRS